MCKFFSYPCGSVPGEEVLRDTRTSRSNHLHTGFTKYRIPGRNRIYAFYPELTAVAFSSCKRRGKNGHIPRRVGLGAVGSSACRIGTGQYTITRRASYPTSHSSCLHRGANSPIGETTQEGEESQPEDDLNTTQEPEDLATARTGSYCGSRGGRNPDGGKHDAGVS